MILGMTYNLGWRKYCTGEAAQNPSHAMVVGCTDNTMVRVAYIMHAYD